MMDNELLECLPVAGRWASLVAAVAVVAAAAWWAGVRSAAHLKKQIHKFKVAFEVHKTMH